MNATLESFQQEWCELKANGKININELPQTPEIYRKNAELSDELAQLQEELNEAKFFAYFTTNQSLPSAENNLQEKLPEDLNFEARVIAEKARSTYDKLKKQRDFQKINHRRVQ